MPKGGGAIRGIDEKLSVSQPTGTATLTVGVFTSPARQGFGPELALGYDSGAGNGPFGLGWGLGVPAITRKTSKGLPRYQDASDSDVFILSGAEDLVPLLAVENQNPPPAATANPWPPPDTAGPWKPNVEPRTIGTSTYLVTGYRPRVEDGFARIERWQETESGDVHWRTISRQNVTSLYGQDPASRIADPDDPARIFSWLLDFSFDDRGNAISYVYKAEDDSNVPAVASEANRTRTANRYLKQVRYGNDRPYAGTVPEQWCFELVLDYGEHDLAEPTPAEQVTWPARPDPFSTYRSGFEIRTHRTCRRLLMFHQLAELGPDPVLVRSTDLTYRAVDTPGDPVLPPLSLLASVTQTGWVPASGGGYQTKQLPALELGYSPLALDQTQHTAGPDSLRNLTGPFDGTRQRWIDLDGEGLQGILTEDAGGWYYQHNVSAWDPHGGPATARFEPVAAVAAKPSGRTLTLTDLNGDGNLCAVSFGLPAPGWFEHDADRGWSPFRMFAATASVNWADPNLRFVDLDGDGLSDVLITEDDAFTWYQWEADQGFTAAGRVPRPFDEDRGPALILADGTGSIYLADMSGDGLADLVRIRNGEVCYWPNLGYGRFGAKITMDAAPVFDEPDQFDQRRVRLADIDGSGPADLVYLGDQPVVWFNTSGSGWTAGTALTPFPASGLEVQASVFDLLGIGTACLVWTSALPGDVAVPLRYIDLTGGTKPHLLTSVVNNLGGQRTLSYAPSTRFYVRDRDAGTPWLTRLPFPVHVVHRVQLDDAVSRTSLVTRYSYHHGCYDGVEREFRGFARVDVLDTDTLPAASGTGTFTSIPAASDGEFELAPVCTRTWYHTGAFCGGEDIAARLAREYWPLDPQAPRPGPTILPPGANAEELREACRALRGRPLRQEVYAQDGTDAAANPYLTTEHRYQVNLVQPPAGRSYGACYAWERESVTCHYERQQADPRVSHELSLAIDAYGNPTRHATVGYPRRVPAYPQQGATLVRYHEADIANVTDEPDRYRLGLPTETRAYELTGVAPSLPNGRYDPDTLAEAAATATEIPYESTPDGTPQRRLLSRERTIYLSDALAELPPSQVDSRALVYATYRLCLTPGLRTDIYGTKVASALLTTLGAFADLDADGHQWAPAPRLFYSPDPAAPDAGFAQQNFYLPQGSLDPWGNVSTVGYDAHNLLPIQVTDAAQNTTLAQGNYRVLVPWLVTDPNLNRHGVRYDPLGMITATAAMGKLRPDGTDEGDHLDTSTAEPAPGDDPTTRLAYDLSAYATWAADPARDPDHPQPAWVQTQARVRHQDPATPWLQAYAYSDGFGRIALTKAQAEPGQAPERDATGDLVRDEAGNLVFAATASRWVGSGRIVYDNKGNPVKAYEPFFDSSPVYDDETDLVDWGVTSITRYDPLGRAIRLDNPDGTYRTVEFGPWHVVSSDENDTVAGSAWYAARTTGPLSTDPDQADAAGKARAQAGTPATTDLDPLGRTFRTVADNGAAGPYVTTLTLNLQGQVLAVEDATGRQMLAQDTDLAGTSIHHVSIDSGERWLLSAVDGKPLQTWDSRGSEVARGYDALRRPTTTTVTMSGSAARVAEQVSYGEDVPDAQSLNLRGAVYQRRDEAGVATTNQRDFQGNVTSASRQLLSAFSGEVNWSMPSALAAESFTTASTYDALSRPVAVTTPDGSLTSPVFNERSLLAEVSVTAADGDTVTGYVTSVSYDQKGQRELIRYGNGAVTSYTYDPDTFRLIRLQTTRPSGGGPLQDLTYSYDAVGNVTRMTDAAQQTIFFANQMVTSTSDYTYDAIYRLTRAAGRELVGLASAPQTDWDDSPRISLPLPVDGQAMQNYSETYSYDQVGNLTKVVHTAAKGNWTRSYGYAGPGGPPASNQLTSTTVGSSVASYGYDANGNVTSMPQLAVMTWDWADRLASTAMAAAVDAAVPVTWYQYDSSGQRVRKATATPGGVLTAERIYLGGYEVYREYSAAGTVTLERQSLHIADGARLICLTETATVDANAAAAAPASSVSRYQFGNLLGSAVLELDPSAAVLSYEEYYPYGSTSVQSGASSAEVSLKRYRYTGKERDPETGLYYYGARYYAPWLGRWVSPDAILVSPSLYSFVRDRPTTLTDPDGHQDAAPQTPGTVTIPEVVIVGQPPPRIQHDTIGSASPIEVGSMRIENDNFSVVLTPGQAADYQNEVWASGAEPKAGVHVYEYIAGSARPDPRHDPMVQRLVAEYRAMSADQDREIIEHAVAKMLAGPGGPGLPNAEGAPVSKPGADLPPLGTQLTLFPGEGGTSAAPNVETVAPRPLRLIPFDIDQAEIKSQKISVQRTLNYGGKFLFTSGLDLNGGVQGAIRYGPGRDFVVDLFRIGGFEEHLGTYHGTLDAAEYEAATAGLTYGTSPYGLAIEPLITAKVGEMTGQAPVMRPANTPGADFLPIQLNLRNGIE